MSDFFDQSDFNDEDESDVPGMISPDDGPTLLVNGSYQRLEVGSNLLQACKDAALTAGFGKFKVFLNGTEIRPSSIKEGRVSSEISNDTRLEIRPFDEAG